MSTPLAKALRSGMNNEGELYELLQPVGGELVATPEEAKLICSLLKTLPGDGEEQPSFRSPVHALAAFFQQIETREAFEVLSEEGIPELCRLYKTLSEKGDDARDDVLFLLKILAMYRSEAGTECVLEAARKPYEPDAYLWSIILQRFDEKHPHSLRVIEELSDPLPPDFLGMSLLDAANHLAIAGLEFPHPFDSEEGISRLRGWLTSSDEDEFSYATSATASLPFLKSQASYDLLAVAMDHPHLDVQMEGAWAAVKRGNPSGAKLLKRWCTDPRYAQKAIRYLEELGLGDEVPEEARDPDFEAMAEMCAWLAHPNEFGRVPHEIELYDSRELYWPPTNDRRQMWVFKYLYEPDEPGEEPEEGLGVVGSVTFALFGETTANLKPLEAYALHCCWELQWTDDERAPEERSVEAGLALLQESNPDLDAE